jgi:protein-tyrosine phosphatase
VRPLRADGSIQGVDQPSRLVGPGNPSRDRSVDEPVPDRVGHQVHQGIPIPVDVKEAARDPVQAQLRPGQRLDQFIQRPQTARQGHYGIGQVEHGGLAIVHRSADPQLGEAAVNRFPAIHERRDDPGHRPPSRQRRVGKVPHESDGAAAVDETDTPRSQRSAEVTRRRSKRGVTPAARTAIHRNPLKVGHGRNITLPPSAPGGPPLPFTPMRDHDTTHGTNGLPVRICCVCLGNICRSPMAAAIVRARAGTAGLQTAVESAGTAEWHVGRPAHPETAAELRRHGLPADHRARRFATADFARLDLVLVMDRANRDDILRLAPDAAARARIHLIRAFDDAAPLHAEVPDPYGKGPDAYHEVFGMLEAAAAGLVARLAQDPQSVIRNAS